MFVLPVAGFPLESVTTTDWIVSVIGLPLESRKMINLNIVIIEHYVT